MCKAFSDIRSVNIHDFVQGEEFENEFFKGDALLHVESFDKKTIARVKYSVSTKIADSLTSGIPLFAYGPEKIASIEHLKRNGCAVIATSREELNGKLNRLFFDKNLIKEILLKAEITVKKYHDKDKVGNEIYNIVHSLCEN